MASKKDNSPPPPPVNDKSRRAFLDELEGRVPVSVAPVSNGRKQVKVKDDEEDSPEQLAEAANTAAISDVFGGGAPPKKKDLGKFEQAPRRKPWGFVILGLVILAAATLTGFWFFSRSQKFSGSQVGLSITLPEKIASGDNLTLTVRYHNDEAVDLRSVQVALEYPEGFSVVSTSIAADNEFKNAFNIGTIQRGQVGEFTVAGRMIGTMNATVTFSGTLSYRPANFNSDFETTASVEGKIDTSILGVTLEGPTKATPGTSNTWTINYENTASRDLTNLQFEVTYPTGFTIQSSNPKTADKQNIWRINTLAANAKGKITFTGTLSGTIGDSAEFNVSAGLVQAGSQVETQAQANLLTFLVNTGLTISIAANGETTSSVINPGDSITYTIKLENRSDAEVTDAVATATLTGSSYDLAKLQNTASGEISGNTIKWNKTKVAGLASIKPQDSVTLTFTVPTVAPTPAKTDQDYNPSMSISMAVTSPSLPATDNKPTALVTRVATIMRVSADARYHDDQGVILGSGPVPPKVGQTTAYRVTWSAVSTTNDVNSFSASAVLPNSVLWTGKYIGRDAGDIVFDPASRTITWSINKVPAGTGSRYPTLTATFEVSITPTVDQVGNLVVLTETLNATGTDVSTSRKLTAQAESLTSDVPNDPQAGGEGKVVQ